MPRRSVCVLAATLLLAAAAILWRAFSAPLAASPVGWELRVENARWLATDPAAFAAELAVKQTGPGIARDVVVAIRYPRDLFLVTDLSPGAGPWLPFRGGQPIGVWQPGATERLRFGFRHDPQSRALLDHLVHRADIRITWREHGRARELRRSLPAFAIVPPGREL